MTSFIGKKTDSSPIKFNFQLENGLPLKAIIEPVYLEKTNKEQTEYAIFSTFSKEEIKKTNSFELLESYLLDNEIWLDYQNCYIVFTNLSDIIIKSVKEKKLTLYFLDEQKEIVSSHSPN